MKTTTTDDREWMHKIAAERMTHQLHIGGYRR